jgi:hypothetical protein
VQSVPVKGKVMSKKHRLEGIRRRIARLESRIKCDQIELAGLKRKACVMTADIAVQNMATSVRNALVLSGMSTNPEPRKPVINE